MDKVCDTNDNSNQFLKDKITKQHWQQRNNNNSIDQNLCSPGVNGCCQPFCLAVDTTETGSIQFERLNLDRRSSELLTLHNINYMNVELIGLNASSSSSSSMCSLNGQPREPDTHAATNGVAAEEEEDGEMNLPKCLQPPSMVIAMPLSQRNDCSSRASSVTTSEDDLVDEIIMLPKSMISDDELSETSDDCIYAYRGANMEAAHSPRAGDDETDFLEMDFDPEPSSEIENQAEILFPGLSDENMFNARGNLGAFSTSTIDQDISMEIHPKDCEMVANFSDNQIIMHGEEDLLDRHEDTLQVSSVKDILVDDRQSELVVSSAEITEAKTEEMASSEKIPKNTGAKPKQNLSTIYKSMEPLTLSSSTSASTSASASASASASGLASASTTSGGLTSGRSRRENERLCHAVSSTELTSNQKPSHFKGCELHRLTPIDYCRDCSITEWSRFSTTKDSCQNSNCTAETKLHLAPALSQQLNCTTTTETDESPEQSLRRWSNRTLYPEQKPITESAMVVPREIDSTNASVTIYTVNYDEKTIIDALELIGVEPDRNALHKCFQKLWINTETMDIPQYLLHTSKQFCNFKALSKIIQSICSETLDIFFCPLEQTDFVETIRVSSFELSKRWESDTDLRKILNIKNKYFHTMNILGKVVNIIRQPLQGRSLDKDSHINIPQYYKSGYLCITKKS